MFLFGAAWIAMAGFGCASSEEAPESRSNARGPAAVPLLVGVTADSPPIIFKQGDAIVGLEADFARELGAALRRPIRFVELRWSQLVPALLDGRIDIIMSGMAATELREYRIAFTEPHSKSAILPLVRTADAGKYPTVESILGTTDRIGVRRDTTADAFVQRNCPQAARVTVASSDGGAFELKRQRIDIFVDDGPAIGWIASESAADFQTLLLPLGQESLAWGVRKGDVTFRELLNRILDGWRNDGTLTRIRSRWLPYYDRLEEYLRTHDVPPVVPPVEIPK